MFNKAAVIIWMACGLILLTGPIGYAQQKEDVALTYKSKCAGCHGQKAEKFADFSVSDADLLKIVMKGLATSKPKMPAFEKTLGEETSKALVAYMKSLNPQKSTQALEITRPRLSYKAMRLSLNR